MDFGADKSFGVVNVATKNLEEENSHLVQNLFLLLPVIHHLLAGRGYCQQTNQQEVGHVVAGREKEREILTF